MVAALSQRMLQQMLKLGLQELDAATNPHELNGGFGSWLMELEAVADGCCTEPTNASAKSGAEGCRSWMLQ